MVTQSALKLLCAEHDALVAVNAKLRQSVIAAQLAGDETLSANGRPKSPMSRAFAGDEAALAAQEETQSSPMAQVATLTREQKILMASLRLGEEMIALEQSNEVLIRRGQQLQEENASLNQAVANVPAQPQYNTAPLHKQNAVPVQSYAPSAPMAFYTPSEHMNEGSGSPKTKVKSSPEEKAERREQVAALLKAGLNQDAHLGDVPRPVPIVPKIQLNPAGSPGGARGRDAQSQNSGARVRENSHSGAVSQSKYMRELAMKDMLHGISQNTPRKTPRN